jgi:hypothetical protein
LISLDESVRPTANHVGPTARRMPEDLQRPVIVFSGEWPRLSARRPGREDHDPCGGRVPGRSARLQRAYKMNRAVRYGFLDFSTLEWRRALTIGRLAPRPMRRTVAATRCAETVAPNHPQQTRRAAFAAPLISSPSLHS